jgi:hypothetical protein
MMRPAHFIGALLALLAGMIAWAAHFTLMYGSATLACTPEKGWSVLTNGTVGLILSAVILAALAAYAFWSAKGRPQNGTAVHGFLRNAAAGVAVLSFIAVAWASLPWLLFTDCRPG